MLMQSGGNQLAVQGGVKASAERVDHRHVPFLQSRKLVKFL